jgi:hypothetical protein
MTIKNSNMKDMKFKSSEEERAYWEKRGPLAKGARNQLVKPFSHKKLESFLSIRLSGKELTEFRDLADKCGRGPSTFGREILLAVLNYFNAPSVDSGKRQIPIQDICRDLAAKMPEDFKEKMTDLMKSSIIGDVNKPSLLVFDPSQIKELEEISSKMLALLIESTNPNVKVVTPSDQKYEKVKSLLEAKEEYNVFAEK